MKIILNVGSVTVIDDSYFGFVSTFHNLHRKRQNIPVEYTKNQLMTSGW